MTERASSGVVAWKPVTRSIYSPILDYIDKVVYEGRRLNDLPVTDHPYFPVDVVASRSACCSICTAEPRFSAEAQVRNFEGHAARLS